MKNALEVLNKYFGYSSFRRGQERVINEILSGKDTVSIMPTGGGKSICYQIPALLMQGITIVISPLISLMKDQVDGIRKIGIKADYINSSLTSNEIYEVYREIQSGSIKILYVAPERLDSQQFIEVLKSAEISMIAVDEAHCVSQWGHDFRTSYRNIKAFIDALDIRPVVTAFTATATEEVREDIVKLLGLKRPGIFIDGFNRENLNLMILKGVNKKEYITNYLKENTDSCGIIYTATRKEADMLHELLSSKGYPVSNYHAGLSDSDRTDSQEAFVYDRVNTIIATNAFGMGIDKPNVRYVIHYNMPKNIESYYQEIGRAGRDGLKSDCILLFSPADIQTQKYLIEIGVSNPERKINDYKKLQSMIDLVHSNSCIRSFILNYFGEEGMESCDSCSSCNTEGELIDKTVDAQKVLSCIYRMERAYGINMLVDVLRGSENKKIRELKLNRLSTYGIMKEYSKEGLKDFINMLISHSYLDVVEGEYPVLKLNSLSSKVLYSEEKVIFKIAKKPEKAQADDTLFDKLKAVRRTIASREGVPPYIIFGDNTLKEMAARYPTAFEQFLDISGVGELKASRYSGEFLAEICAYVQENNIKPEWSSRKTVKSDESKAQKAEKEKSYQITVNMIKDNPDIIEVSKKRQLALTTIFSHIIDYAHEGNKIDFYIDFDGLFGNDEESQVLEIIKTTGHERLKPIKDKLPGNITYDQIRGVIIKNFNNAV